MGKISFIVVAGCIALCIAVPVPVPKGPIDAPAEVLYRVDKSVTLDCPVNDKAKAVKYSWTKNEQPLSSQKNVDQKEGSLVFNKPQIEDEGQYRCFAESNAGVSSSRVINFKRTYLVVPEVKTQNHEAVYGKPYVLPCSIPKGYPKPTITWKKQKSDDFIDRRILASPEGSLYFTNITDQDVSPTEKYECLATSPAVDGEVLLAEHVINSKVKDSNPSDQGLFEMYISKDLTAKVGDRTFIYCIYGGTPLTFPDWFKEGKNINGDENIDKQRITRHNRSSGRRLLIKDTYLEDQGTYTCKGDNGVGKAKEHNIKLTVVSAPTFTKKPEQQTTAKEGQDLTIPCQVSAVPAAKVEWTHNAKPLAKSDRVAIGQDGLKITKVQKSDQGYYGCRAVNDYGDEYVETLVTV